MGKESIKEQIQRESAEVTSFSTLQNSIDMSSRVFSSPIITQTQPKITAFLFGECVFCKAAVEKKNAVAVNDGLTCTECLQNLTETTFQILKTSDVKVQKVVRLFKCFGCNGNYSVRKMSNCLAICRNCFKEWKTEDKRVQQRLIEKSLNKIGGFLGRRI